MLRIALKMSMEPRVTAAKKAAELSKRGADASGDAPEADRFADLNAPSEPSGPGEEGATATREVPFVDLEVEKRLLAVIEGVLSCRGIVNRWNDDRQHRENLANAKNAAAEAGPELTSAVAAALLGSGAVLRKTSSKLKSTSSSATKK